jgi:hypothetical protein
MGTRILRERRLVLLKSKQREGLTMSLRSRFSIVALAFIPLSTPGVARSSELRAVPFELRGGHIFVQAYVNGTGPFLFGFDTGASGIGRADVRLATQLALPKVGEEQNSDGIKTVTTDVVSVERLRLGPVEKRNVRLLSRNYNGSHTSPPFLLGIIGRDFFADRLLTIDYPNRTLTFSRGRLSSQGQNVVRYRPGFRIPVCIGTKCLDGTLDTGSSSSLVLPKEAALANAIGPAKHVGSGRRMNSVAELYEVQLSLPIKVGGVIASGARVLYADRSEDTANVGSDFLKDYVVTIDQRHHLLRISRPASN